MTRGCEIKLYIRVICVPMSIYLMEELIRRALKQNPTRDVVFPIKNLYTQPKGRALFTN